jgi:hypothetical protein
LANMIAGPEGINFFGLVVIPWRWLLLVGFLLLGATAVIGWRVWRTHQKHLVLSPKP